MHASLIEPLELRVAPAGVLNVQLIGGHLVIRAEPGTDGDSQLALDAQTQPDMLPGGLIIDPDAGTSLRFQGTELPLGEPLALPIFTGSTRISLGEGADTVIAVGTFPKSVFLDLGPGANVTSLVGVHVLGDFTLKGGSDNDNFSAFGGLRVAGNLSAFLGDGANQVSGSGALSIGKSLLIKTGKGDDQARPLYSSVSIGRHASIETGGGADTAGFGASIFLSIGGNLRVKSLGTPTSFITQEISGDSIFVGGNLEVSSGPGPTLTQVVRAGTNGLFIGGNATLFAPKTPADALDVSAAFESDGLMRVGNSVKVVSSPSALVTLRAVGRDSFIPDRFEMAGGRGLIAHFDGVIGQVKLRTSSANLGLIALTASTGGFQFRITHGLSIATPNASGTSVVLADLYLAGNLKLQGGNGAEEITMDNTTAIGAISMQTGAGNDRVSLATSDRVDLGGTARLNLGAGEDVVELGGNDPGDVLRAFAAITIDGGAGVDSVAIGTMALLAVVPVVKNVP